MLKRPKHKNSFLVQISNTIQSTPTTFKNQTKHTAMSIIHHHHHRCATALTHKSPPLSGARKAPPFLTRATSSPPRSPSPLSNAKQLLQSGAVRAIEPKDAGAAVGSEGYVLLDIRPAWEREKARVKGSLHVPLYVADEDGSPVTLLKKWVHFGYIGLWTGQYFTTLNPDFLVQVEAAVPDKTTKLLVACGEGLRSMVAASKLYGGDYKSLGWLAGGFNRSKDGDFAEVEGDEKLQYAAIGGTSYIFLKLLILLGVLD